MAHVVEDIIMIRVSRLTSDSIENELPSIIDKDLIAQLTELFTELAGPKSLIEIEKINSAK